VVLVVGGGLMVGLGMYDDKYELGAWAKLLGQVVIALFGLVSRDAGAFFIHNQTVSLI